MTATLIPAPPAPSTPNSLLLTLRQFTQATSTRRNLQHELDAALSSFLSNSHTPLVVPSESDPLSTLHPASGSTCANEAVRPPNEAELGEIIRIGFMGMMEVKDEVEALVAQLRMGWRREDLAGAVEQIERCEDERLKQTIQRDQLRRLAMLQPDDDFTDAITNANKRRAELEGEINEGMQKINAEVCDLAAAETE